MKTSPVTSADLARSVLSVPPLARLPNLEIAQDANRALIRHLEAGGVSTLLYGGNANLYNIGMYEYAALLDFLERAAGPESWVIPSAGPDFGKLMDQAYVLRERAFPTVMVLPQTFPATPEGSARAIDLFAEAFGRPVIVYIKAESFLTPVLVENLVRSGVVAAIKYAVVRADPRSDPFLTELVDRIDRRIIVSGIGERPAAVHMREFGLQGFTSGSVCIAPRGSMKLLDAIKRGDDAAAAALRAAYMPLEDLRDSLSPIRVLHEAVTLAGIADMGPLLPHLSNLEASAHPHLQAVAQQLLMHDRSLA